MIYAKIIPISFLFLGIFFLMQIILPYLSFQIWEIGLSLENKGLISPQMDISSKSNILGISIQNNEDFSYFISSAQRHKDPKFLEFSITVPKLRLEKVDVLVDSNDLTNKLAHLPGSALPGEKGNVFISGHSALNFFKGVKKAPFANLADLKKGDQIEVLTDGTRFVYEVISLRIVKPDELSVISAPESLGRYITLMTCVPPGLNFKRLIVLGKMI